MSDQQSQQPQQIELRTYCSMCIDDIAECEPRKMVALSTDPYMRKKLLERGYMKSHSLCAAHFQEAMKKAISELNDEQSGAPL